MSKTHNADTRRRTWRYIAIACVLGVFMLVIFGAYRRAYTEIDLSSDLKLRLLYVTTRKNPEFGLASPGDSLRRLLPYRFQRFLSRNLKDPHYLNLMSDISDPTGAEVIWKMDYPAEWLHRTSDLKSNIQEELESAGIMAYRVKVGPGSYTPDTSLEIDFHADNDLSKLGIKGDIGPNVWARMRFAKLPVFQKDLTIQIISQQYYGQSDPKVVREISMANPVYREVTRLKPAVTLPAVVSHDNLEVHLRALVTKVKPGVTFSESDHNGITAGYFIKNSPIPASGPIPAECFVRGDKSDPEGYRSAAVLQILRNGKPQSEWGVGHVRFTYGLEGFEVPSDSRIRRGDRNLIIDELSGDLSLFPQPLKASVSLIRIAGFPPDEMQSFEFPLPKEGESFDPNTSFTLWDGQHVFKDISYKKPYHMSRYHNTPPGFFNFVLTGKASIGNFAEIKLTGPNGTSADISNRFVSGGATEGVSYLSYDLGNHQGDDPRFPLKDYADYSTVSLTLQHPRTQNFTFDFITSPAEATGKL